VSYLEGFGFQVYGVSPEDLKGLHLLHAPWIPSGGQGGSGFGEFEEHIFFKYVRLLKAKKRRVDDG